MSEYTPEQIALAEAVVDRNAQSWGWGPLSDFQATSEYGLALRAALAAIADTTERVTDFLDQNLMTPKEYAWAIRNGDHLKADTHVTIPKMRMGLVPKDEERGQY